VFPYQNRNIATLSGPDTIAVGGGINVGNEGELGAGEVSDEILGTAVGLGHCLQNLALHFVGCNGDELVSGNKRNTLHGVYPFLLLLVLLSIRSR